MSVAVASTVPTVCRRADAHSEASLLPTLRPPLGRRYSLGGHVVPTRHLRLKTAELRSCCSHGLEGGALGHALDISGHGVLRRQMVLLSVANVCLPPRRVQVAAKVWLFLRGSPPGLQVETHALLLLAAGGTFADECLCRVVGNTVTLLTGRSTGELRRP